ncbi:hypothetical protein [uncultured Clostridium sp.]|uniref:hypothetical protein n=1 Tax=uncultured Clostridium sp. TaxID=59620 RepID=UPI0026060582|nr:hypothetical protein [uncultured Clostridium sp.]
MKNIDTWDNTLNIHKKNVNKIFAYVTSGDDAVIVFDIVDYVEEPVDVSGQEITLYNNEHNQTQNITVTNKNIITVKLDQEFLAKEGIVELQFKFKDSEGQMSTPAVKIEVQRKF